MPVSEQTYGKNVMIVGNLFVVLRGKIKPEQQAGREVERGGYTYGPASPHTGNIQLQIPEQRLPLAATRLQ